MLLQRTLHYPLSIRDRVTAIEVINGVRCRVVLEQDLFGRYRERSVDPIAAEPASSGLHGRSLDVVRGGRRVQT